MKKFVKTIVATTLAALLLTVSAAALAAAPALIGVPDDATNQARAIKLLETAGLIEVDPAAGYSPEIKDITKYIYNVEVTPVSANTLTSTLDDFAASTINGTYAVPYGLRPSRDALIIESQSEDGSNPYVNVIVARSADAENETYKTVVAAYQTQLVAEYLLGKYTEAYFPAFPYDATTEVSEALIAEIDEYINSPEVAAKIAEVDLTQNKIYKVGLYKTDLDTAIRNFGTKNPASKDLIRRLTSTLGDQDCKLDAFTFESGVVTLDCITNSNLAPDNAVQALYELDEFDNIIYTGFAKSTDDSSDTETVVSNEDTYKFTITFNLRPLEVEEPAVETAVDNTTEEGGAAE